MVPTETLAKQHFKTIQSLFAANGIQVSLLLGSFNASQKAQVKERLSEGGVDILIGTHALFSEDVKFLNLGLAIINFRTLRISMNCPSSSTTKLDRLSFFAWL
jgi:ATP-dependent DNA helicase RecG